MSAHFGGRASEKVAHWALERSVSVLRVSSRSPIRMNSEGQADLSHQETALLATVNALRSGDHARATLQATWLVKGDAVHRLLRSLTPLAKTIATTNVAMPDPDQHYMARVSTG